MKLDEDLHGPLLDSGSYAFQLSLSPSERSASTNLMLFQLDE